MKKIFLTGMLLLALQQLFACDICGCSTGTYFIGPFPHFHKHFIGMRYSSRSFISRVKDDATEFSKDFYQTVELWGGCNLGKKWQLIGFVPYNINLQSSDDGKRHSNGIGDITLLANYKLFDTKNIHAGKQISQQLLLGAGIKIPTGKFKADPDEIIPDANNQPGTGSVDWIANAMYSLQINNWGINSNANYRLNTEADKFHFGNRFSAAAFAFRSFGTGYTSVSPNAGLLYENLQANKLEKTKIENTGGNILSAAVGVETKYKSCIVGFNVQVPLSQDLSNGQTKTKLKGMVHLTFAF